MLKVKRKGLNTDCIGNKRTIRVSVSGDFVVAIDNHVVKHVIVKTRTCDKIRIKVTLMILDTVVSLPCFRPKFVSRVSQMFFNISKYEKTLISAKLTFSAENAGKITCLKRE